MLQNFKLLSKGQLNDSVSTIYTVPAGMKTSIAFFLLANTDNSNSHAIDIYYVLNDGGSVGTAADSDLILHQSIDINGTYIFDLPKVGLVLGDTNDSIQAVADTTSVVNYFIFGVEEVA